MNKLNSTESPYQINKVVAPWLSPVKEVAGIFIDFSINPGDKVTHEFKTGEGSEPDTLIYHIQSQPGMPGPDNYTDCLYKPTKNKNGLTIALVVDGEEPPIIKKEVPYSMGGFIDEGKEYEIDYVTAPFASFEDNRSVYIIINMDMLEGDFVCGNSFKLATPDKPMDQFVVNVISSGDNDRPLVPYIGIFGPFETPNGSVELGTSVNGNVPISSPVGIKSYGNDFLLHKHNTHQTA